MNINLIAKYLAKYKVNLKLKAQTCNSICAFTGEKLTEGVLKKKLLSDRFTDYEYVKYDSDYVSIDIALCMSEVIPAKAKEGREKEKFNSLRCYSYFVNEDELKFLNKEDAYKLILSNSLKPPYILVYSYSNKKHTCYKTRMNYSCKNKTITTDEGIVQLCDDEIAKFLPILQNWYTIIPEHKGKKQEHTFFTKDEILNGSSNMQRIQRYSPEKYFKENEVLKNFRDTQQFKLLTDCLQRQG